MHYLRTPIIILLACTAPAMYADSAGSAEPIGLFLTFVDDPATSIVIDWHREPGEIGRDRLYWRPDGQTDWRSARGTQVAFPFSERMIYRVFLDGLQPDTLHDFNFGEGSRAYRFHTLPATVDSPVRIVFGGDTRHEQEWMEATNRQALQTDPHLIVWGGDLAYADGRADRIDRWYEWFAAIRNTLIHADGRVVPIIVGIGNHEVRGGTWRRQAARYATANDLGALRAELAPYFMSLFAFPGQPGFGAIDVGDYLSLLLLDSDHLNPVAGAQTEWLRLSLDARRERPWLIPVYHQPAWPSYRNVEGHSTREIRHNWVPLFEEAGVRVAMENHDHTYKRTEPLHAGSVVDHGEGIVYLGDGSWGVRLREPLPAAETWYLAHSAAVRHLILLTIHNAQDADITVIDENGVVIDTYAFR
jgi:hypothetical protein